MRSTSLIVGAALLAVGAAAFLSSTRGSGPPSPAVPPTDPDEPPGAPEPESTPLQGWTEGLRSIRSTHLDLVITEKPEAFPSTTHHATLWWKAPDQLRFLWDDGTDHVYLDGVMQVRRPGEPDPDRQELTLPELLPWMADGGLDAHYRATPVPGSPHVLKLTPHLPSALRYLTVEMPEPPIPSRLTYLDTFGTRVDVQITPREIEADPASPP